MHVSQLDFWNFQNKLLGFLCINFVIGYEADKLKPSQIPRPKTGVSSPALKHNEKKTDNNYFVSDTQHIQRLQVPNIPGIFLM